MILKKYRLQSPDEDNSGTDVAEIQDEEVADQDNGDPEQLEQEPEAAGNESAEEITVVIEGEQEEEHDPQQKPWVNELRRKNRENAKLLRQLQEENERLKGGAVSDKPLVKPKLEDFDYDSEAFVKAMDEYYAKKVDSDRKQAEIRAQQEAQAKEFQALTATYESGKSRFQKEKMMEAEEEVVSTLSQARQSMLLEIADDPAALVVALGSNPEVLRKLASVGRDAQFIKQLTLVEKNMKVQTKGKGPAPTPERIISGSGKTPGSAKSSLEALKADAERSGDYTKYYAEKRRLGK